MLHIGIDTSTTNTAIVALDMDDGLVSPRLAYFELISPKDKDILQRSAKIAEELEYAIECARRGWGDEQIIFGIEGASFMSVGKRDKLVMLMGHVYYTILSKYEYSRVELLPPSTIKKKFTGNGRAKKDEVISTLPERVKEKFEEKYKKIDDLADAYAIAAIL